MSDPVADTRPGGSTGDGARRRRVIAPFIAMVMAVVIGALVFVLATAQGDSDTASTPLLDQLAPDVTGELADGTPFQLSRRKGSWVVLNFFTDDCVPCIVEHPELVRFVDQQRSLGADGAEFYSIVQQSTPEEVDRFFAERGGDWPVVYDTGYQFQIEFGVAKVPETWIIDPSGVVRGRIINTVEADTLSQTLQAMRGAGR